MRKSRLTILLAVALGVVAFALWPRGARLEWYTSPVVDYRGELVRFQALVPAGWRLEEPWWIRLADSGKPVRWDNPVLANVVSITPPSSPTWLPKQIRDLLYGPREEHASVQVLAGLPRTMRLPYNVITVSQYGGPTSGNPIVGARPVATGPGYMLIYSRTDRAGFEATYRRICESLRVVKQGAG